MNQLKPIWKNELNVLVIEDNLNIAGLMQDSLLLNGFTVDVATSAREALVKITLSPPDVILSDVMMPGMDGFDLCKVLKASPEFSKIPVIFVSACQEKWVLEKGFALGAADFVPKPFNRKTVLDSIHNSFSPYRFS